MGVCGTEICLTEGLWNREDLCFPLTLRQEERQEERQPWGSLLAAGFPAKQSPLRVSSLEAVLCPKGAGVCPSHSPRKTTALQPEKVLSPSVALGLLGRVCFPGILGPVERAFRA